MPCKACGGEDHHRASSKLCPNHIPRLKNTLRQDIKKTRDSDKDKGPEGQVLVVSTVLKRALRTDLKETIVSAARTLTCVAAEASRLLNFYLLNLLQENSPIPNLSYNNFLRKPFQLVAYSRVDDRGLLNAHELYNQISQYDCRCYAQLISNMAKDYEVNCMNHVSTNVNKWVFKWYRSKMLKHFPNLKASDLKDLWKGDSEGDDAVGERSMYLKTTIESYGVALGEEADYKRWWEYIPLMWYLQKRLCKTEKEKSFTLVPITNYGIRHIRIDTDALYYLSSRAGLTDNLSLKQFRASAKEQWERLFPDIKETKNKFFAFGVTTDGVACSYYYQKRIVRRSKVVNAYGFDEEGIYHPIHVTGRKIVGYDPGRIDAFTAVHGDSPEDERVTRLSRREYYMMTGMTKRRWERDRWTKKREDITTINATTPPKRVPSVTQFLDHCHHVAQHLDTLVDFYGSPRFTRQKFKTYVGKQKAFDEISKRLTGGDRRVIIAFGNGSFPHNSRGGDSTPLRRLFWELRRRCTVRLVDEYRTSITCSLCEGDLPKRSRLWQVKVLSFLIIITILLLQLIILAQVCNDVCLTHWNRDVNAARNIKNIFLHMNGNSGERPWPFRRAPADSADHL
ncbi:hypothetical protein HK104_004841 [Borealophlyctis nickersoniae]|nr:hypothetical protein HK104_004841 [Borealophlyctis nickersoniae]